MEIVTGKNYTQDLLEVIGVVHPGAENVIVELNIDKRARVQINGLWRPIVDEGISTLPIFHKLKTYLNLGDHPCTSITVNCFKDDVLSVDMSFLIRKEDIKPN